jgi:hypothetical protein
MNNLAAPVLELCSAEYTATLVQVPDGDPTVFVLAQGTHPTSGYEVVFHQSPSDVYPPRFSLWHFKLPGTALDLITPFAKFTSFKLRNNAERVIIADANGENRVPIKPIRNVQMHQQNEPDQTDCG